MASNRRRRPARRTQGRPVKSARPVKPTKRWKIASFFKPTKVVKSKISLPPIKGGKKSSFFKPSKPVKTKTVSKAKLVQILEQQEIDDKIKKAESKAVAARNAYKPRIRDKGKMVLIGVKGQRNPQSKGRKGYLIYVTQAGKKQLVRVTGELIKPRKISDISAPVTRNLNRAAKEFEKRRLVLIGQGKSKRGIRKGRGVIDQTTIWDFSDATVDKIAMSIHKALTGQRSHRSFLISVNIVTLLSDKSKRLYSFAVPIARRDHLAVEIGGIHNFVRQKFYAFMARQLQYDGFVSSGSANHIRHLPQNAGLPREEWTQDENVKGVYKWRGNELDILRITHIEWKIEQTK